MTHPNLVTYALAKRVTKLTEERLRFRRALVNLQEATRPRREVSSQSASDAWAEVTVARAAAEELLAEVPE